MAGRRQSSRLSKQTLKNVSESKLKTKRELISKYAYDDIQVKSAAYVSESTQTLKTSRPKSTKVNKSANLAGPPDNWKPIYEAIKDYRKVSLAPVDNMGCERLSEETVDEKVMRPLRRLNNFVLLPRT